MTNVNCILKLDGKQIVYKVRKSKRAKRLRVTIYSDSSVVVTVPRGVLNFFVERFLQERAEWLMEKVEHFKGKEPGIFAKNCRDDYLKNKDKAFGLVNERLEYFNQRYKYNYNRVSIKNQKTRWGSCSRKGNLNFNYKIVYLNKEPVDYIVVHELCHLKELNHSQRFWDLVAEVIPKHREVRKELKNIR